MDIDKIALIDIGSNTIRLVIFEITADFEIYQLLNIKTPARLSQYIDADKRMSQQGITVLIEILKNFHTVTQQYEVSQLLPMATAAVRQSINRDEIVERVKEAAGVEMQIVPEEKEAYYGSYAVFHTTQIRDGVTVDIGGGSTEITFFKNKEIQEAHSFPFGVVSLKKMFFEGKESNDEKAIKKMAAFVKEQFQSLPWLTKAKLPIIAMGGSARSIANVHQRQRNYPLAGIHGYRMSQEDLKKTLHTFKSLSPAELQDLDGLSQDRTDIIIPANVVFDELFETVKAPEFIFSNKGLREGIIMSYLNEKYTDAAFAKTNIATQTIYRLGLSYHAQNKVADQRGFLVGLLYDELSKEGLFKKDRYLERLLQYGSYLYYLGEFVESGAISQHTFYIISNSEMDGLSHQERVIIALLASYKNASLFHQYLEPFRDWFTKPFIDQMQALGGLIKLADALNDSHMNVVKSMELKKKAEGYELVVHHEGAVIAEKYRASRQKKNLDRLLKGSLQLTFIEDEKTAPNQGEDLS